MAHDEGTGRWERLPRAETDAGALQVLRAAIGAVRAAPRDPEARRRLRAHAAERGMWDELALLLADEVGAVHGSWEAAAALWEELADVHENLDQPLEAIAAMEAVVSLAPAAVEARDRLAWLYRRAGAWAKAAEAFERVAELASDDRARAALRAAGKLYRDHGRLDRAVAVYQAIVARRPADLDAWRALDELLAELGRWRELADVRGAMAARVERGVEKAVLLRAQARAFERAGDAAAAAERVAAAAGHAPDDVSGVVDYASVLARDGRGREAADVLAVRVAEAVARAAAADDIAALRARLASTLEDDCGDAAASARVLELLLADAPAHVPALERLARQAASDPRAHAAALGRLAAALPAEERLAPLVESARRYRDAPELKSAARAFEGASELAPDDDALRGELEDARTAVVTERAAAEAAAGDLAGAERRLRAVLASRPDGVEANLALVDVLARGDRLADAAEHLRATLATAPDGARTAPLVHRYAQVAAALGDADEAHQLLHEAHHLDRRALPITLALGESCYARRLWREAALHLGSLAEHADAPRHAAAVAAGLVHAAQAEVRARRPGNARKHYEAAVRLAPNCAPAWHALAELAMETGDMARAADCLEREAAATPGARDRLRLYDALGELALDVLGDAARAERCWARVADVRDAGVLEKLLAVQRARGAGRERGETCELLAALAADARAAAPLYAEAAEAFAADGELARARAAAERVVAARPLDDAAVTSAAAAALALGDTAAACAWVKRALPAGAAWDADDARAVAELARALGARLGVADERLLAAPPRAMASDEAYAQLTAAEREVVAALVAEEPEPLAAAVRDGPMRDAPMRDAPMRDPPIRDAPMRDAPMRDAPMPDAPMRDAPMPDAPMRDAPMPDAPMRDAPMRDAPTRDAPARDAPMRDAPMRGAPMRGAPMRDAPMRDAPMRDAPTRDAPARDAPMRGAPMRGAPMRDAPMPGAPMRDAPMPDAAARDARGAAAEPFAALGELLELMWEAAALLCPDPKSALEHAGLGDARRAPLDAAAAALYPQIANALGGPATLLYASARASVPDVTVLLAAPPVVVIGPRLASVRARSESDLGLVTDPELRFWLGRAVESARPRRIFALGTEPGALALLLAGARHAFGTSATTAATTASTATATTTAAPPATRTSATAILSPSAIARESDRLRATLPMLLRRRASDWFAAHGDTPTNDAAARAYTAASARAADRAGLLACGSAAIAIELAGGPRAARHLVRLAASPRYFASRRALRKRRT